ncbi:uncharacterized protein L201_006157 [Kwoniella dendrophila CBS 6074]|uniref:Uncharacterized protein n=1 Tax=Kwoniella dendrophila CBS 6074 TaxID=1295534 RepID=A0AAX4K317_9TREE
MSRYKRSKKFHGQPDFPFDDIEELLLTSSAKVIPSPPSPQLSSYNDTLATSTRNSSVDITSSQIPAVAEPLKRKRGRPPKNREQVEAQHNNNESTPLAVPTTERPGRKPKILIQDNDKVPGNVVSANVNAQSVKKKRSQRISSAAPITKKRVTKPGNQAKDDSQEAVVAVEQVPENSTAPVAKKRRGRPPKKTKEVDTVLKEKTSNSDSELPELPDVEYTQPYKMKTRSSSATTNTRPRRRKAPIKGSGALRSPTPEFWKRFNAREKRTVHVEDNTEDIFNIIQKSESILPPVNEENDESDEEEDDDTIKYTQIPDG